MGPMPDGLQPGKGLCRDVGDAVVGQIETLQFFQDFHSRHGKRVEHVVLEVELTQGVFEAQKGIFSHFIQATVVWVVKYSRKKYIIR